jgi:predicted ATP-dependent serine protease
VVTAAALPPAGIVGVDLDVREPRRFSLGVATLDRAFGQNSDGKGGIVLGSTVLFAGDPGAGKTTTGIFLAEALDALGVLYAVSESTREQFSLMVRRLGRGAGLRLFFSTVAEAIVDVAEESGARVLIVDQLHSLEPRKDALRNFKTLDAWAKRAPLERTLVVIAERNKEGSVRGDFGVEYAGDVTIEICKPALVDEGVGVTDGALRARTLLVTKNRHGDEGVYRLELGARGWQEVPPAAPATDAAVAP